MTTTLPYKNKAGNLHGTEHPNVFFPFLLYGRGGFYEQLHLLAFILKFNSSN